MADLKEFQRKMEKTLDVLASDFAAVREELRGEGHVEVIADRESKDFFSLA